MIQQLLLVCGLLMVSLFIGSAWRQAPAGHLWPVIRAASGIVFLGLIYRKLKRKPFDKTGKSAKRAATFLSHKVYIMGFEEQTDARTHQRGRNQ
jgi:hypothetical protein